MNAGVIPVSLPVGIPDGEGGLIKEIEIAPARGWALLVAGIPTMVLGDASQMTEEQQDEFLDLARRAAVEVSIKPKLGFEDARIKDYDVAVEALADSDLTEIWATAMASIEPSRFYGFDRGMRRGSAKAAEKVKKAQAQILRDQYRYCSELNETIDTLERRTPSELAYLKALIQAGDALRTDMTRGN